MKENHIASEPMLFERYYPNSTEHKSLAKGWFASFRKEMVNKLIFEEKLFKGTRPLQSQLNNDNTSNKTTNQ